MFFGQYAPWENYPKKLRHFEVVNPLVVITDFFSANLLGGHSKKLKNWRRYVLKDKVYKDKRHGPGSLLFFYDLNVRLLEAAYSLYYNDRLAKNEKVIVSVAELEAERKLWDDFPVKTFPIKKCTVLTRQPKKYSGKYPYSNTGIIYTSGCMQHFISRVVTTNWKRTK